MSIQGHPIPDGTRPLVLYRHSPGHVDVLLPPPVGLVRLMSGDTLIFRYSCVADDDGRPRLQQDGVDVTDDWTDKGPQIEPYRPVDG